jgi:hypothetical protein
MLIIQRRWTLFLKPGFWLLLGCLACLALNIWFIHTHPLLYWGDAYVRLVKRDQLFITPWPPLLQTFLFIVTRLSDDLTMLRSLLALLGPLTLIAFYRLAALVFNPTTALIAVVWLAANKLFMALASVPYQELLFLSLLFAALYHLRQMAQNAPLNCAPCKNLPITYKHLAVIFVNLACLARYEGFLLVLILATAELDQWFRQGRVGRGLVQGVRTLLLYGTAALLWGAGQAASVLAWGSTAVSFPNPLELPGRLLGLAGELVWAGRLEILGLALVGLVAAAAHAGKNGRYPVLAAFLFLNVCLLIVGDFFSPGNLRRPFLPTVFLILYAAVGITRLLSGEGRPPLLLAGHTWVRRVSLVLLVAAIAGLSAVDGLRFMNGAANEPVYGTAYVAAAWFNEVRPETPEEARVVLFTDLPIQAYVFSLYTAVPLDKITVCSPLTEGSTATPCPEVTTRPACYIRLAEDSFVPDCSFEAGPDAAAKKLTTDLTDDTDQHG